ncbi:beta/alpha barrel domain-containing protein [Spirosoma rhododendri]|uniref:N-(5'-phosphoribosyl)anthranilate isomerase n=1 Tax=Spirosoma rhododendri TaxID=2728024 RepID=A0A7L5DNB6_9BACT|nr:N-(5'-phosphoribosyl)anthranilate isomerase [Spirosoma rhododendri]QJD79959.1 N-(5'-phosphoribosyl)anthranilate isomerase [Spirosoma rhododendri]
MALTTLVKISNVTNLSDARYCAGMGVDMLGFSMDADAPDYIDPVRFADIRGWVAGVQIVGETHSTDPVAIEQLVQTYQPDYLQVDDAAMLPYLASFEKPLILRVDMTQTPLPQLEATIRDGSATAEYILLENGVAEPLTTVPPDMLYKLAGKYPILLGAGITAENVHELLDELPIRGIALRGGDEDKPGDKDFGELMDILEAIEEE